MPVARGKFMCMLAQHLYQGFVEAMLFDVFGRPCIDHGIPSTAVPHVGQQAYV